MATSREGGELALCTFCAFCSAAICQAHATVSVSTATPPTTANQMRRYRRWEKRDSSFMQRSVLLLGEDVAHAAHGQDALGRLGVGLDCGADPAHMHLDSTPNCLPHPASHRPPNLISHAP